MGSSTGELDIAVIGFSGRFPGASTVAAFWDNLVSGRESITFFSDAELLAEGVPASLLAAPNYVKAASILDGVDLFDAEFFGYSAKEAARIDPQSRLFLECAWEALECAGYAPSDDSGSIGLYASQSMNTYLLRHLHAHLDPDQFILSSNNLQYVLTNINDFLTTRVSYKLNLKGPSVNVQCACSSSLVAVHMACQSLIGGECRMALAGGASIYLPQRRGYSYEEGMILSPDGHCRAFDAEANGTVFGRGVGVVVLKMAEDAIRDGDAIYAVIKGSAINNDGANKVGFTAPSVEGQARVIAEALENAGLSAETISYIEAHGTGTAQGDPIEIAALTQVYRTYSRKRGYCAVGTVKANFGHLDAAAGIAGLIKACLMLHNRKIPPQVHFRNPNPLIDFAHSPFFVARELMDWEVSGMPRRAGVSAFGMGGTNAHLILEEAPVLPSPDNPVARPAHVLTLSAKNVEALERLADRYLEYFDSGPSVPVENICYTANTGRRHFPHRLATVGETIQDLHARLRDDRQHARSSKASRSIQPSRPVPPLAFLFTGQGAQYACMGRELQSQPVFLEALKACEHLLESYLPEPLCSMLNDENDTSLLNDTRYTQPALFALEYALARLWMSWGIKPAAALGHSIGEYVAACIAGVFSLQDGLKLVAERARLMGSLPRDGGMAAVFADEYRVEEQIAAYGSTLSIAAVNGPSNTVISGRSEDLEKVLEGLAVKGIKAKRLNVSHAFHSPLMESILDAFEASAARVAFGEPEFQLISNVSGKAAGSEICRPGYWREHMRQAVRFADGIKALDALGCRHFVEIGPQPVLIGMAMQNDVDANAVWLPSLRKGQKDWQVLLSSLKTLYSHGHDIDWSAFDRPYHRRRVSLPTYPFKRLRHWIEGETTSGRVPALRHSVGGSSSGHPLIGGRLSTPQPLFESAFETRTTSWFQDHRVFDRVVIPGTAFLEMALAGLREVGLASDPGVEAFDIEKALILEAGNECRVQLVLARAETGGYRFQIFSNSNDHPEGFEGWTLNAQGLVRNGVSGGDAAPVPIESIKRRCTERLSVAAHYRSLKEHGLEMGPSFQGISELWRGDKESFGRLEIPAHIEAEKTSYIVHPCLLDACLQVVLASLPQANSTDGGMEVYVPVHIESLHVLKTTNLKGIWSHARLKSVEGRRQERVRADVTVLDGDGCPHIEIRGLHLRRVSRQAIFAESGQDYSQWLYGIEWEPLSAEDESATAARTVDYLPAPLALAEEVESGFRLLADEHRLDVYRTMAPEFNRLCAVYIWAAFQKIGGAFAPGRRIAAELLIADMQILPKYRQLVLRYLEILTEDGYLKENGHDWEIIDIPSRANPDELLAALRRRYPECRLEFDYIALTGPYLAEILTGMADPLQLLFPHGDLSASVRLYQQSGFAQVFNGTIRKTVEAVLQRLPSGGKLRILEVGAGTGGTTSFLLPHLDPQRVEYAFTDVTPLFLHKASELFQGYPFVRYEILNLEKDPDSQGFKKSTFDLIIGANVVHATQDLQKSLGNLKTLLVPGGLLLLLEVTGAQRFADITVGTLDGWWRFEDHALRPSYPLLPEDRWRELLVDVGFAGTASVPERCDSRGDLSQQAVILAAAPGANRAHAMGRAPNSVGRRWLVFGDPEEGALQLKQSLALQGENCELVVSSAAGAAGGVGCHCIDAYSPGDYKRLLKQLLLDENRSYTGIVHLWGFDHKSAGQLEYTDLEPRLRQGCGTLLYIIQALIETGQTRLPRLWIVTRGACCVGADSPPTAVEQAPLWGMARVITMEHPELACTCVDLDPSAPAELAFSALQQELMMPNPQEQIAVRGQRRYGARLVRADLPEANLSEVTDPAHPPAIQVVQTRPGILESLAVRPAERRQPGPGEVEIRVSYAGLNFLDVLTALDVAPVDRAALGHECSGTIVAVGSQVTGLTPGEKVVAITPDCFRRYVTSPAGYVYPIPDGLNLSLESAATIPVAYLTAFYALHRLGGITAGQSVLIHSGAGGVGLAAVKLARQAGAIVYATAGSPQKRAFLRELGVEYVMDSRSLEFTDQIMEITRNRGIDIVLNSLAGDFIAKSIAVLHPEGCFLEIGKTKITTAEQFAQLKPGASYYTPDLMSALEADPSLGAAMMASLWHLFASNKLQALPVTVFPVEQAGTAFQYMAKAKHIGKIVLSCEVDKQEGTGGADEALDPNATYLITGGLGGLGLLTADWMAEKGARHIVLMGRSKPDQTTREALRVLERRGVRVLGLQVDVADFEALSEAFRALGRSSPPLRGIVHAAGVLDDGMLLQQTWPRFMKVFGPKIQGSWNLHTLTREMELDFFIVYSSIASVLGSAGQANHAAANAFMDALMYFRKAERLPALSINWGAWGQIGAAVERNVIERWASRGISAIEPLEGMQVFDRLYSLACKPGGDRPQVIVLPIDWQKYWQQYGNRRPPDLFAWLWDESARSPKVSLLQDRNEDFIARLATTDPESKTEVVVDFVRSQVARCVGLETPSAIRSDQVLSELGLDSLLAVELRTRLSAGLGLSNPLPATLVFDYPTIESIVDYLFKTVLSAHAVKASVENAADNAEYNQQLNELEQLSEEEAEALLLKELSLSRENEANG